MNEAFTPTKPGGTAALIISDQNGMGKVLGGDGGGATPSSATLSFCACKDWRNSSLTRFKSSFLPCDAAKSACILSCAILDAATSSCSARIISKTCAIVTAPSSTDGVGVVCLVFLILAAKNLKNTRNLAAQWMGSQFHTGPTVGAK